MDFDDEDYNKLLADLYSMGDDNRGDDFNLMGKDNYFLTWWDRLWLLYGCSSDVLLQTAISARFAIASAVICHIIASFSYRYIEFAKTAEKRKCAKQQPFASAIIFAEILPLIAHFWLGLATVWVHFNYQYEPIFTLIGEILGFYFILNFIGNSARTWAGITFIAAWTCLPELSFIDVELWHSIRGCHMILAMKLISFLDYVNNLSRSQSKVDFLSYLAYCTSPTTAIYGPWISFEAFCHSVGTSIIDFYQWIHIAKNAFYGVLCLIGSTCALNGIIFNAEDLSTHLLAARDSYSFILSHFFISYLSTVIATAGGIRAFASQESNCQLQQHQYIAVSKPFDVLVPHSLTQLVVAWSLPMNTWLKRYVFRPLHKNYGPFAGILATYTTSALLHGFSGQIAIVLLSVGIFTYVEFRLRNRLAKTFDACVGSKPCEDNDRPQDQICHHKYDLDHPIVKSINVAFSFYAVVLFTYATSCFGEDSEFGSQAEGYSVIHLLRMWSRLNWFGHLVSAATFAFDMATR